MVLALQGYNHFAKIRFTEAIGCAKFALALVRELGTSGYRIVVWPARAGTAITSWNRLDESNWSNWLRWKWMAVSPNFHVWLHQDFGRGVIALPNISCGYFLYDWYFRRLFGAVCRWLVSILRILVANASKRLIGSFDIVMGVIKVLLFGVACNDDCFVFERPMTRHQTAEGVSPREPNKNGGGHRHMVVLGRWILY